LDHTSPSVTEPIAASLACYAIDGRSSRFTVQAFAAGVLSAMGHNPTIGIRDVTGEMSFNPDRPEARSLRIAIKASSLAVENDISARDIRDMESLMNQEVLESIKFPEIRYEASDISVAKVGDALYSATLNGNLTLHGVTRRQPIKARVTSLGDMLRTSGDFAINQTDYNIKLVSVAGGALKLKNELKFSFEIVARRKP
jgi:polyisoprenoid-binding protein YceI